MTAPAAGHRRIKALMLGTDVGFLLYWVATATELIPPYPEQVLVDWNWSYLVLDLMASGTGLAALWLLRCGHSEGRTLMVVSLALTHAAGLTALNFWVLRQDYSLQWWLPNVWLTLFPVVAVVVMVRRRVPVQSSVVTSARVR